LFVAPAAVAGAAADAAFLWSLLLLDPFFCKRINQPKQQLPTTAPYFIAETVAAAAVHEPRAKTVPTETPQCKKEWLDVSFTPGH
jgi:hypothetical protein